MLKNILKLYPKMLKLTSNHLNRGYKNVLPTSRNSIYLSKNVDYYHLNISKNVIIMT